MLFAPAIVALCGASPLGAQSLWERSKAGSADRGVRSIYVRPATQRPPIQVNDIVLVLVTEDASASNDARLDSRRELEAEILIDKFARLSGLDVLPDNGPHPEIEFSANRDLKARGRTDRRESVRLRIAARVVDVLPNGTLMVEARKQKRINAEETVVSLSGVLRSQDISDDYTVPSDRLADMKLAYSGEGPVSANTAWTWLGWIIDKIWPF
ncbi:MAG: flagellar basal body L-ring protein FlgH [Planctomycetota bacterium]